MPMTAGRSPAVDRMVQIAVGTEDEILLSSNVTLEPHLFMSEKAAEVTGITTEMARNSGRPFGCRCRCLLLQRPAWFRTCVNDCLRCSLGSHLLPFSPRMTSCASPPVLPDLLPAGRCVA